MYNLLRYLIRMNRSMQKKQFSRWCRKNLFKPKTEKIYKEERNFMNKGFHIEYPESELEIVDVTKRGYVPIDSDRV